MKKKFVRVLESADRKLLGVVLRDMRKRAGLSQPAMAEPLGLNRASISNIESGKHTISLATLISAAQVAGLKVRIIIEE